MPSNTDEHVASYNAMHHGFGAIRLAQKSNHRLLFSYAADSTRMVDKAGCCVHSMNNPKTALDVSIFCTRILMACMGGTSQPLDLKGFDFLRLANGLLPEVEKQNKQRLRMNIRVQQVNNKIQL